MGLSTYTLHLPGSAQPGDPLPLERAVVVRDGFSWMAFLFTFLWFFWHRLWLAGILILAAVLGLAFGLRLLGVPPGTATVAEFLLMVLVGLEASSLRRWTLERHGRPAVDAVVASDLEEAETKSFSRWLARGSGTAAFASPVALNRAPDVVLGFFPEAERMR